MSLLQFIAFLGTEIIDLYKHYQDGKVDEAKAAQVAMRMARKVSDEIALREIPNP